MEAIRAAFVEGDNMFPSSAIFNLAHIQIAVKNTALIRDLSTDRNIMERFKQC